MYQFQQDDKVRIHPNAGVEGVGRVVGCATVELPVMGRCFIVDLGERLSPDYPFTCVIVPEIHLTRTS
jgi:hypothetical protein